MKRVLILLFVVSSVLSREADADEPLFARWYPAERISGPLGSGTGRLIYGMMQYGTFPNRRYILLGYVRGIQNPYLGYFWASRQAPRPGSTEPMPSSRSSGMVPRNHWITSRSTGK